MSDLATILAFVGGAVLALWGVFTAGRRRGAEDINNDMREAYNGRERDIADTQGNVPDDPDAVLAKLREHAKRGRGDGNP